jgi:hypothetical protein
VVGAVNDGWTVASRQLHHERRAVGGGSEFASGTGAENASEMPPDHVKLAEATGHSIRVIDYHQHAIGAGADAQAVAYLELRVDETRTLFGVGKDADIVSASLKAIVSGLERARAQGARSAQSVVEAA